MPKVLQQLCSSSAAHNAISGADALYPLLRVAVSQGNRYNAAATLLSELHEAAGLVSAEQLVQLLQLGMLAGTKGLQQLAALSSTLQEMPVAAVETLLRQAVQQQGAAAAGVVQCLGGCPAVRQLSRSSTLQLVRTALQCSVLAASAKEGDEEAEGSMPHVLFSGQIVEGLQEVLGPAGVAEAVQLALQMRRCGAALLLCRTHAASEIPAAAASRLLQLAAGTACSCAEDRRIERMVEYLPNLRQLQPQQLQELLAAAVKGSCSSTVASLLQLPAAPLLQPAAVEVLLHAAVAVRSEGVVELMCQLRAAREIGPAAAGGLLKSALLGQQLDACRVTYGEFM